MVGWWSVLWSVYRDGKGWTRCWAWSRVEMVVVDTIDGQGGRVVLFVWGWWGYHKAGLTICRCVYVSKGNNKDGRKSWTKVLKNEGTGENRCHRRE